MRSPRPLIHLLLAMAVLLCGLHIGEPAHAEDLGPAHASAPAADRDAADHGDEEPGMADEAAHHHCPVAPDASAVPGHTAFALTAAHCARPAAALLSLSRAPPVEPPTP